MEVGIFLNQLNLTSFKVTLPNKPSLSKAPSISIHYPNQGVLAMLEASLPYVWLLLPHKFS
jgi:hypothetical protein